MTVETERKILTFVCMYVDYQSLFTVMLNNVTIFLNFFLLLLPVKLKMSVNVTPVSVGWI